MVKSSLFNKDMALAWPDNYYSETKPAVREKLIKAQLEKDNSKENQLRYRLWEKRYTLPKKGMTGADYYMRVVMGMEFLCEQKSSLFGKRTVKKGIQEIRDTFCLDLLKDEPDYSALWKNEFLNFWSLYVEVCKNDKNYSGVILGMGKLSDNRLKSKLKNDIQRKTSEFPEELGLAEDLTLYRQAAWEVFSYYF